MLSDVHVESSPIEKRADALYDSLQMTTNVGKSGSTLVGELWGGRLARVSGTLGPRFDSRIPLMLITVLVAAIGLGRMFLRRLLKGRNFTLAVSPAVSASAHALPKLFLLREALSAAAHTA